MILYIKNNKDNTLKKETSYKKEYCSSCNKAFTCGSKIGESCWCNTYSIIMPLDFQQSCLCSDCLGKLISKKLDKFIKSKPLWAAMGVAGKNRNDDKIIEHIDYHIENGKNVFSAWYLLKRGYCCDEGCRNCPYRIQHWGGKSNGER